MPATTGAPALSKGELEPVFAHGSGSNRLSTRNRQVAAALNGRGLATLLLDLLTVEEEMNRANVFDIGLLNDRLVGATRWAGERAETKGGSDQLRHHPDPRGAPSRSGSQLLCSCSGLSRRSSTCGTLEREERHGYRGANQEAAPDSSGMSRTGTSELLNIARTTAARPDANC